MHEELEVCDIHEFSTFDQRHAALDLALHSRLSTVAFVSQFFMDLSNDHHKSLHIGGLY